MIVLITSTLEKQGWEGLLDSQASQVSLINMLPVPVKHYISIWNVDRYTSNILQVMLRNMYVCTNTCLYIIRISGIKEVIDFKDKSKVSLKWGKGKNVINAFNF